MSSGSPRDRNVRTRGWFAPGVRVHAHADQRSNSACLEPWVTWAVSQSKIGPRFSEGQIIGFPLGGGGRPEDHQAVPGPRDRRPDVPLLEGEVWRPVGEQRPEAQVGDRSIPGLLRREGRVVNDWITITRQSVAHLALVLTSRPPSAGRNPSTCSMWRGASGAYPRSSISRPAV